MSASVHLENLAFALMGRLHVTLRRQTGRVIDIEYMRIDPAYCRYVLKLAADPADENLYGIFQKLEEIYFGPDGLFLREPARKPLLTQLAETVISTPEPIERHAPKLESHVSAEDVDRSYVGRLR